MSIFVFWVSNKTNEFPGVGQNVMLKENNGQIKKKKIIKKEKLMAPRKFIFSMARKR